MGWGWEWGWRHGDRDRDVDRDGAGVGVGDMTGMGMGMGLVMGTGTMPLPGVQGEPKAVSCGHHRAGGQSRAPGPCCSHCCARGHSQPVSQPPASRDDCTETFQ